MRPRGHSFTNKGLFVCANKRITNQKLFYRAWFMGDNVNTAGGFVGDRGRATRFSLHPSPAAGALKLWHSPLIAPLQFNNLSATQNSKIKRPLFPTFFILLNKSLLFYSRSSGSLFLSSLPNLSASIIFRLWWAIKIISCKVLLDCCLYYSEQNLQIKPSRIQVQ